jgi:hypothetical protein
MVILSKLKKNLDLDKNSALGDFQSSNHAVVVILAMVQPSINP